MFYEKTYALMKEKGLDAIVVSDGANMRYLSGFRGATGYLYISEKRRVLMTDARYTTAAREEAPDFEVQDPGNARNYGELLNGLMEEDQAKNVGFEEKYMLYGTYQKLSKACNGRLNTELGDSLDRLRSIKTEQEIAYMEKAEAIGDQAFSHILTVLKPGMTELEVAAELEYFMKMHGAEKLSFETIVASGPNSALPHAMPSTRKIEKGDFVTMDFGCVYNGYCSDMTRTVVMGKASDKQKEIYGIVLEAQQEGLDCATADLRGCDVDRYAREVIARAGYWKYFGHGLGHSVGLYIHEDPRLSPTCEETLRPYMVETVEPGIYLPGFGGVRIEDMVMITEGYCVNLTHSPKELIEL
ncbi:MAG: aminopeptidase P family protein [Eubacteriales bacterium]|nr:aminopeptidase P family protein [Eubacteriales bacterium]